MVLCIPAVVLLRGQIYPLLDMVPSLVCRVLRLPARLVEVRWVVKHRLLSGPLTWVSVLARVGRRLVARCRG